MTGTSTSNNNDDDTAVEAKHNCSDNLLVVFGLSDAYQAIRNIDNRTFSSYLSHLPGDNECEESPSTSLMAIVERPPRGGRGIVKFDREALRAAFELEPDPRSLLLGAKGKHDRRRISKPYDLSGKKKKNR